MSFGSVGRFHRRRESEYGDQEQVYSTDASGHSYEPGSGAEYMARSGWGPNNNGAFAQNTFSTDERPITFVKRRSSKSALILGLIIIGVLLILLVITVIILFSLKVLVLNPEEEKQLSTEPSLSSTMITVFPTIPVQPYQTTKPPILPPITSPVPPPTPVPTSITLQPPVEEFIKRDFVADMYILQQANPAYEDRTHFEYLQAVQMILNGLKTTITQSTLGPYLLDISIAFLENSGDNLLVQFNIYLNVPVTSGIDATVVRNVLLSSLYQIEQQLNGVHIDPNTLSVIQT